MKRNNVKETKVNIHLILASEYFLREKNFGRNKKERTDYIPLKTLEGSKTTYTKLKGKRQNGENTCSKYNSYKSCKHLKQWNQPNTNRWKFNQERNVKTRQH